MRITCPNCSAQYEIADDAIGSEGRDVQCSNCDCTWFASLDAPAQPPSMPQEPVERPLQTNAGKVYPPDQVDDPETAAPARDLAPDVKDILQQEAARELQARQNRAQPDWQSQPDLGLADETQTDFGDPVREDAPRRDRLPNIEEINSSLAATPIAPRAPRSPTETKQSAKAKKKKRRIAFRMGFVTALLILALLTCAYVFTPNLIEAVPSLSEPLNQYVLWVNDTRQMLFEYSEGFVTALQQSGDTTSQ